ncbi:ferredoxin [Streptomyces malaysiense]|uniref:Ferredoxin n=1 Tax=Streptomyces malaysiense TaxID=1428626 RepID=A0A1J4Q9E3_9ACTN|nr:ferredoxin [Streptomyces malaysiense]OIK28720.1 ferredoxin [Streptomyces malaysiense]
MRITVDHDRCVGSGLCAMADPDSFTQSDEDGTVRILSQPQGEPGEPVRKAVDLCPSRALRLVE